MTREDNIAKIKSSPPSIKKNIVFNFFITLINVGFPIISFSYVSRILGPEIYGSVVFASSLAFYFALIACLGLPVYGAREIAKYRDNLEDISKVFSELFIINLFSSIVLFILYWLLFLFVDKMKADIILFSIFSLQIFFNIFNVDWLFYGVENYGIITIRNFVFKILSLLILFCFVHEKSDYYWFAISSIVSSAGVNIVNIITSRKYIKISFKKIMPLRHTKPLLAVFITVISTSIYNYLDNVMLGFLSSNTYVGYYGAGMRIIRTIMFCIVSIGYVILPRYSLFIEKGKDIEFKNLAQKAIDVIYMFSLPFIFGLYILSPQVIKLLAGNLFYESYIVIRITVPLFLVTGLSNFIGLQILFPKGKEWILVLGTSCAAMINIVFNLLLIPLLNHIGAAISILITESTVLLILYLLGKKDLPVSIYNKKIAIYILASAVMGFIVLFSDKLLRVNLVLDLIVCTIIGAIVYFSILLCFKDKLLIEIINLLKTKIVNLHKNFKGTELEI